MASKDGRMALSIEGPQFPLTDMPIKDERGNEIGYVYALADCPIVIPMRRYLNIVGTGIPKSDTLVAKTYNERVGDAAVCSFCIFHIKLREESAKRISVGGKRLECLQLGAKSVLGDVKILKKNLDRIGIHPNQVLGVLRNNKCIYALIIEGSKPVRMEKEIEE
ncbi:MAG: hypothetical protein ACE5J3_07005, partial [Methanosarcinales archaeon]